MTRARSRPIKCSAVISDVDGTLVTNEKVLTERTKAAAAALRANGILFSIISSRPPRGLRMLIAPLGITAPIVCFNGGMLATADLTVVSAHLLPSGRRSPHGRHARRTPSRCLDLQRSGLAGAPAGWALCRIGRTDSRLWAYDRRRFRAGSRCRREDRRCERGFRVSCTSAKASCAAPLVNKRRSSVRSLIIST